jgi:iron complex outermembrane recepter protein
LTRSHSLKRKWLMASSLFTTLVAGTSALAQDKPADAPAASSSDEIVVTGSRIKKKEYVSTSPVTIITAEKSTAAGLVSPTEVLQSSSIANGSGQINNTFTGYVVDGGGGINTISLRGLGAQRSLVLLNGRRMPPSGVSGSVGAVDLNTIPDAVVSRYEILKDGASSIYGSDAVAGVVNVITRTSFEGLELDASARVTEAGGGDVYNLAAVWGKSFDKGHVLVSLSGTDIGALTKGDRKGFDCPEDYIYKVDGSRADLIDSRTGNYMCWSGYTAGGIVIDDTYFREPRAGSTATIYGVPVPGWFGPVPLAQRYNNPDITKRITYFSPTERYTLFAQGEYRPTWAGGAELYSELLINQRKSEQHGVRYLFPYYDPQSPQNPFGNASGVGAYVYPYFLTKSDDAQDSKVYRGLVGARGTWKKWEWDVYLSHSSSQGTYTGDVIPKDRVYAGTGLNEDTFDFNGVCPAGAPAGCLPLNLLTYDALMYGKLTDAERAYFFKTETGKTTYTQTILEGSMTGDLFQLPAGALSGAFGFAVRKDKIDDVPGEFSRASNAWGSSSAGITRGEDTLSEAYFELEVPVIKGKPFIEDFKINLSGRYSDYDSVGDDFTYKAGLNWAINNTFRIRGTYGTSFRAPALYELYLNDQTGYLSQRSVDPCINWGFTDDSGAFTKSATIRTNCAAAGIPANYAGNGSSALIQTGGGLDLKPETSTASNFGIIFTPANTGFKLAVDYWKIEVNDQISSTGAGVVGACYGQPSYPNNGFCSLFTRNPTTHFITFVDASYRNIPSEKTSGVDITASYEKELNFGTLSIDGDATFTEESVTQLFPGDTPIDYNTTVADPAWVGNVQTKFKHKDWTISHTFNYVGPSSNQGYRDEDGRVNLSYAANAYNTNNTKSWGTHDITVRYRAKTWSVIAGVINLTDKKAPILSYGDNAGSPGRLGIYAWGSQYTAGYYGRQFYSRVSKTF